MKTDKTVSACIIYSFMFPWISTIFSCVRRKSSFNLLWNDRLTFCVSHNLWPPQIKTASSTDSLSLARCTRYFCISSQALHSTAPSGSLSSKSEWLTMHDIAWCTMVLVLPCFIYVMPSIRIARNCMITPNCCIHVHVLSKQQFTNALIPSITYHFYFLLLQLTP